MAEKTGVTMHHSFSPLVYNFVPSEFCTYQNLGRCTSVLVSTSSLVHTQILYGLNDFMSCIMHLLTKNDSIQEQEKCGFPSLFHSNFPAKKDMI